MVFTPNQIKKLTERFSKEAGEPVTVEQHDEALFIFGSELACLRLEHKRSKGEACYSKPRESWYFFLDTQVTS